MSRRGLVFIAVMTVVVAVLSGLSKQAIESAPGSPSPSPQIYVTATMTPVPCSERVMKNENDAAKIESGDTYVICYDYGAKGTPTISLIGTIPPRAQVSHTQSAIGTATSEAVHP